MYNLSNGCVYINPMEEIYYFASPVHGLFPNNILTIKPKKKILINQLKYKQHTDDNHA